MKYPSYSIRLKQEEKDELKKLRKKVKNSVQKWIDVLRAEVLERD